MTSYVQLRESSQAVLAEADDLVTHVAYALFNAWFPRARSEGTGPVGEDLENWKAIAVLDAKVVIDELRFMGLLTASSNDGTVVEQTKGSME